MMICLYSLLQNPVPRAKKTEREEFNTICDVGFVENAVKAEEYMTNATWTSYNGKENDKEHGGNFLRTLSTDSGVPPSPQGHNDFSSCEDVFTPEDDFCDSYMINHKHSEPCIGKHGRSASLSSGDGCKGMPIIGEYDVLDSFAAKIKAGTIATQLAEVPSVSTSTEDYTECTEENDPPYYSIIDKVTTPATEMPSTDTEQPAPMGEEDLEGIVQKSPAPVITPSRFKDQFVPPTLDSGYISANMMYNKMAICQNEITEETSFKTPSTPPSLEDGYIPSQMAYSILAVPPPSTSGVAGSSSGYVSGESFAYSKLGSTQNHRDSGNFSSSPPPSPSTSGETVSPYVTVGNAALATLCFPGVVPPAVNDDEAGDQMKSEIDAPSMSYMPPTPEITNQLDDFVRGADLMPPKQNKSQNMGSQEFHVSALAADSDRILSAELISKCSADTICAQEKGDNSDTEKIVMSEEGRSRNESTSSSSGYLTDSEAPVSSHYVSPAPIHRGASSCSGYLGDSEAPLSSHYVSPRTHRGGTSQYANLAFSQNSESQNDDDARSATCKDTCSDACRESAELDSSMGNTSFVEYVGGCADGERFVNDCLQPSQTRPPLGDDGYVPCTCGGDSGYILHTANGTEHGEDYLPMSPIRKNINV